MPKIIIIILILNVLFWTTGNKGDVNAQTATHGVSSEWIKYNDSKTGLEVWQITNHDSISEALYFYANSFTADDRYFIFRSKRSGTWNMFRCDLQDGSIMQLTDDGVRDACIHPDGVSMIYLMNGKYFKLNLYTLEKELVMDLNAHLTSRTWFRPTFTNDGRYTLVVARHNTTSYIYRVDLVKKELIKVHEQEGGSMSHQLINPADPNLISYVPGPDNQNNMKLPLKERPRTRLIRVDEGTNEPFLITPYGHRATHDSWSPQGDRMFFFEKKVPGWAPVSIVSIDKNGENYTRHFTEPKIKLGHGAVSKDGKWFITDSQEPGSNPLILLNLEDGKIKTLCWPDASINTSANVHVHPNFSISGNYVIYTSDVQKTNIHQVYVVPISKVKKEW